MEMISRLKKSQWGTECGGTLKGEVEVQGG